VIGSFKHKGLKRLYEKDDESKLKPDQLKKIRRILSLLDIADAPGDLDLPGYGLHPLKGDLKGHFAVSVSGNWRITFRIESGHAEDVDLVDYH
jgi:proteic killer suppression protein